MAVPALRPDWLRVCRPSPCSDYGYSPLTSTSEGPESIALGRTKLTSHHSTASVKRSTHFR